jgi:ribonuclease P protein subunit POP4
MRTPENLVRHELIGLRVRIVSSPNRTLRGLEGKVVDETRTMLVIERADGSEVSAQKETSVFSFELGGARVRIDGRVLVGRPEDRIRKKLSKW